MPKLVVNMEANTQNKHYLNLKNNCFKARRRLFML